MKKLGLLQTIAGMFAGYQPSYQIEEKETFNTGRRYKYARGPMSRFKQQLQHKKHCK